MRESNDELDSEGRLFNGYDYELQVWVVEGRVQPCGHPRKIERAGPCCTADRYQGALLEDARAAEAARALLGAA
jgi:hypothetical protein